jgi:hypothetical protein
MLNNINQWATTLIFEKYGETWHTFIEISKYSKWVSSHIFSISFYKYYQLSIEHTLVTF